MFIRKSVHSVLSGLILLVSLPSFTLAASDGSGHSGGGSITEADLRYFMGKIDSYIGSDEGKKTFPEIVAYDEANPNETFHQIIEKTFPVVQKGELKDEDGVVRDCVSYAKPDKRYFVCNSDALPSLTLENQPSFYRIVLHELLVQAGIEKPQGKDIPSEYKVSYRITENVHLETYQEWVPGKIKDRVLPARLRLYCLRDTIKKYDQRIYISEKSRSNNQYEIDVKLINGKYHPLSINGGTSSRLKLSVSEYQKSPYSEVQYLEFVAKNKDIYAYYLETLGYEDVTGTLQVLRERNPVIKNALEDVELFFKNIGSVQKQGRTQYAPYKIVEEVPVYCSVRVLNW